MRTSTGSSRSKSRATANLYRYSYTIVNAQGVSRSKGGVSSQQEDRFTRQPTIGDWIKRTLKADPPRSKSLIITIFGDLIAPHVSAVWLSELIALLHPFQVNERLVRTSCFRLTEEGWLTSQREGRRSRYALTSSGLERTRDAYHRVYDPPPVTWDGCWMLVILKKSTKPTSIRAELRRELGWKGFGLLAPGIFLHPSADPAALREMLERLKLTSSVAVLQARDLEPVASCPMATLVAQCWNLDSVAGHYRRFVKRFQPALPILPEHIDPQTAYVVQTLLVHSFRRIVLHDPRLPASLLPAAWPGHAAYDLCREIYLRTYPLAQAHLAAQLEEGAQQNLTADDEFARRFGGLTNHE